MATLNIPTNLLARIIRCVAPAASTDGNQPIMTGVLLRVVDRCLEVVATDSYRLHQVIVHDHVDAESFSAIVPAAWLTNWAELQSRHRTNLDVTITIEDSQIITLTSFGDVRSTPLIQGDFPGYKTMLEAHYPVDESVCFSPKFLARAFEAAFEWSRERPLRTELFHSSKPCKFTVDAPEGRLDILLMPVHVA